MTGAKLGIIAGAGELPARLIEACQRANRPYFVLALIDQATLTLGDDIAHTWIRLGAAGKAIGILKREGVRDLVMAGAVKRPSMAALRPDAWALKTLAKAGVSAFGDDGLLRGIVAELENEGFCVVGVDQVLVDALAPSGALGAVTPDREALADIAKGFETAKILGAADVGQGVVVQQGLVLAVEAIEGTDEMLGRCSALARDGLGGVLVKVSKPNQERRADLPSIGVATVHNAKAAGLRGIAIEAGNALIVDQVAVIAAADQAGIFVVGVSQDATAQSPRTPK